MKIDLNDPEARLNLISKILDEKARWAVACAGGNFAPQINDCDFPLLVAGHWGPGIDGYDLDPAMTYWERLRARSSCPYSGRCGA